ncbi:hypothetical protein LJC11_04530, partial [Bacteroidales bacterium OttesenSCG-928-I21]|nr:hypothetical protein [Bacteroidales bacterium OttesenSCG-928-I21]
MSFMLLFFIFGGLSQVSAQRVDWSIDGPPEVNRPMINLTADETATISISFYVRNAAITDPKVQVTLPAGVVYVANSAAVATGNTAGDIGAVTTSGQVVTIPYTASIAAEKKVALTLQIATTINAAGCSFEEGNVDVKIMSGTTMISNGGQAQLLPITAIKPAFVFSPKSAGPTGGVLAPGAAVVAGLANPGTGGVGTDKGTFKINLATTERTAKGLRITFTVDANTTLENFAFAGTVLTTQPTRSGNVYTMNLPDTVFSTTNKELSFDAFSKYSGAHPITIGYQYVPAVNCVNATIANVYSLNYIPVVGTPYFPMPTQTAILAPTDINDIGLQPHLTDYQRPMDGTTSYYYKVIYKNSGTATAQEIVFPLTLVYTQNGTTSSYHDETKDILYSIDGGAPKPVDRKTYSSVLGAISGAANEWFQYLPGVVGTARRSATTYIDNDVVPANSTLIFYFPIKSGLIYDNTQRKISQYGNSSNSYLVSTSSPRITSKSANGTNGDRAETSTAGFIECSLPRFESTIVAKHLRFGDHTVDEVNFRVPVINTDPTFEKAQTADVYVKIPPFIELTDEFGNVTTDITDALTWGPAILTALPTTTDGLYKIYGVNISSHSGQTHKLALRYKTVDDTNPISAGYTANFTDSIEYWMDMHLGAKTAADAAVRPTLPRIIQSFVPVTLAVEKEGISLLSFSFRRTTKGLKDSDNNRAPDDNTVAPDDEIDHTMFRTLDKGEMIVTGVISAVGANTIFNNLYMLFESEFALNGGVNVTLKQAELTIKRNGGQLTKPLNVTTTASNNKRYLFFENVALLTGDSVTLVLPFECGTSYPNVYRITSVQAYVDIESTLRPTDPFDPDATVGYTKYGKDKLSAQMSISTANVDTWLSSTAYTRPDNSYFTADLTGLRISADQVFYANFNYEVNQNISPQTYTLVMPIGYKLGGTYGEKLRVRYTQGTSVAGGLYEYKNIDYATKTVDGQGRDVYTYDLTQLFDPSRTEAGGDATKWMLPDDACNFGFYASMKATSASNSGDHITGNLTYYNYKSDDPSLLRTLVNYNRGVFYTGLRYTLTTNVTSLTAYSRNMTIPSLTAGNPNETNLKMWLYVDSDVSNVKAQKLGSMDFPIPGAGTDGRWVPLGLVNAQTGVDYSLDFDYTNIQNCEGDTIVIYVVAGTGAFDPIASGMAFSSVPEGNIGQSRRIVIKPASASILSSLSVSPTSLVYQVPYTVTATVNASSSQGILKNDTLVMTIPMGQKYIAGSAKVEYPMGTPVAVSAAVESELLALNADLSTDRTFYFSTGRALDQADFAFDGIASGVPMERQRSVFTAKFQPECDTRLTGIRYVSEPRGYNSCGELATGSGRNFRSEVMISNITTGYDYSVSPVTVSGNRAFNEISTTEKLEVTITKTSGVGIAEPVTDSLVVTMPSALNVSGPITLVSSALNINTTIPVGTYSNTVNGDIRTIAANLPMAAINSDSQNALNKAIVFTMSLNYTPDGQVYAINPEQSIDAIVQTNVKFDISCPNAPAAVGNGSLGVAFVTALENAATACLNMPTSLEITSDGFQGKWYEEQSLVNELSDVATHVYTPSVQIDTVFYVSAIISGTDYGVVPVNVRMNPELKPSFSAPAVCFGQNTIFVNTTTLDATAAPSTVTYEWYEWTGTSKTPFDGANFTAKSPSVAFPAGTYKAFVIATSLDGCVASSDTIEFTVNALPTPTISGRSPACYNSIEVYTTEAGMTNYSWTMSKSDGVDFDGDLSPSSSETATVTWTRENVVGVISVNYTDANGCRAAVPTEHNVIVRNLPPTPPAITGPTAVCVNSRELYKIPPQAGISDYIWTVDGGAQIVDGQHTNAIEIKWETTPGSNRMVSLYTVNADGCQSALQSELAVKVNGLTKPIISGNLNVCANGQEMYSTQGASTFEWYAEGGNFEAGSQFIQSSVINWGNAGAGRIAVKVMDINNCEALSDTVDVVINTRPTASLIGPQASVCAGEQVTYTAEPNQSNYVWEVTGHVSYTGGQSTDNTITVTWGTNSSGTVKVNYSDGTCYAATPFTANIS